MHGLRVSLPAKGGRAVIALDWGDPGAVRAWAERLRIYIDDAVHAGLDATDAPADRMLGRKAAREQLEEAEMGIGECFAFAGLDQADDNAARERGQRNEATPARGRAGTEGSR